MSSTDARTDGGATPATAQTDAVTDEIADTGSGADELTGSDPGGGTDVADTLDLRLPDELIDLIAGQGGTGGQSNGSVGQGPAQAFPGTGARATERERTYRAAPRRPWRTTTCSTTSERGDRSPHVPASSNWFPSVWNATYR